MTSQTTRGGHLPTLVAAFLHFDVSFMLWVLIGALGVYIARDLGLSPVEKGLLVAVPILSGSLLRIPLGLLGDRIGERRVGIAILAFLFLPLALGWRFSGDLPALLAIGLMLGTAGASFAVALPLASRWYPKERQGLVMGIAAAGNSGTVIANLLAPRLAAALGWQNVFAVAMLPLALVLVAFVLMARSSPQQTVGRPLREYAGALRQKDLWIFCLFYGVTFGGYVGLSSFLPLFWRDQYGASPVNAGYLTALAAFIGSGVRPIGGYLADRVGGVRMLGVLLLGIGLTYSLAWSLPSLPTMAALVLFGMACLGMGNGAVFQLVPQRFRAEIGIATGVVGAIGGLGGFLLPVLLGVVKAQSGSFGPAFALLACVGFGAFVVLRVVVALSRGWRVTWRLPAPTGPAEARE